MALTRVPASGVITGTTFTFNSINVTATTVTSSTATGAVVLSGGLGVGGSSYIGGNLTVLGNIVATILGTATSATNIASGLANQIVYQANPGQTGFLNTSTSGSFLQAQTNGAPVWTSTASMYVNSAVNAQNLYGGSAGQFVYQTGAGATSFVSTGSMYVNRATVADSATGSAGSVGSALTISTGLSGSPSTSYNGSTAITITLNTATLMQTSLNVANGVANQLVYQTGANATSFISTGTTGQVLQATTNGAPTWTNASSLVAASVANSVTFNNSNSGDASGTTFNGSAARTISANTLGALSLASGGTVSGAVTFSGPVTFSGTATYSLSTNTYYTDNIIELHVPPAGVNALWTVDDGKDIGLRFHYYTNSTDTNAALVLANDTKWLEWYSAGAENANTFVGSTYGNFKTGGIWATTAGGIGYTASQVGEKFGVNGGGYFNGVVTATTFIGALTGSITGNAATANKVNNAHSAGTGLSGSAFDGSAAVTWTLNTATLMQTSVNLASGATGSIPYQSSANTTNMLSLGTLGYVLTAGASGPTWTATSGVTAGSATTATSAATAYSTIGTLTAGTGLSGTAFNGSANQTWTLNTATLMSLSVTAQNLSGGAAGSLPYQSGANTTTYLGIGTSGYVLTSNGSAPVWTAQSSVAAGSVTYALTIGTGLTGSASTYNGSAAVTVSLNTATLMASAVSAGSATTAGSATNLSAGSAMAIPYQSAAGTTAYLAAGTGGYVLSTNGTGSAPSWVAQSSIAAGSAPLTNTYVGYGNASNLLTGSANLTWDGTSLNVSGNIILGNGGTDTGLRINHGAGAGDYGRIRFYQAGVNNQTIHAFPTAWQGGTLASSSAGAINIQGANGVTFGSWNNLSAYIGNSGDFWASSSIQSNGGAIAIPTSYKYVPGVTAGTTNNWIRGSASLIMAGASNTDGSGWSYGHRLVSVDYGDGLAGSIDVNYNNGWTNNVMTWSGRAGRIGNVGIGTTGPNYLLHVAGTSYASSDTRAPLFYDSDNTGYYCDPAGTSVLNGLTVSGSSVMTTGSTISAPIFYDSDNTGYYVDPAGTSQLNVLLANHVYNGVVTSGSLSSGTWYTIAANAGNRASAKFQLVDQTSGLHQSVVFYAAHHFGTDGSNAINVISNSYYGGPPLGYIRIKENSTYEGAVVQVYVLNACSGVRVFMYDNEEDGNGWTLVNWVNDNTNPGTVANWGALSEKSRVYLGGDRNGLTMSYAGFGLGDDSKVRLFQGNSIDSNPMLRIQTDYAYGDFGAVNSSWFHHYTNASSGFYWYQFGQNASSWRAPIFYDSNDTNYYLDSNGTSVLNEVNMYGRLQMYNKIIAGNSTNDGRTSGIWMWNSSDSNWAIYMAQPGVGVDPGGSTMSNGYWNNEHTIRVRAGGFSFERYDNNSVRFDVRETGTFIAGQTRSPIFYDSDNTGYYCDPAGTSVLNGLTVSGSSVITTGSTILIPRGTISGDAGCDSTTGVGLYSVTMSGYSDLLVQLGGVGGSTPSMQLRANYGDSFWIRASRDSETQWDSVGSRQYMLYHSGVSSISAPIFYDSNNTSYYCDPASTSVFNQINPANIYFTTSNPYISASSYFIAPGGAYFSGGTVYCEAAIQARGGISNDSAAALTLNGGTGGYTNISGSARSPIFYDLNDTGYYFDGTSGTRQSKYLTISGGASGNYGNELVVGNTSVSYSLEDGNLRPIIQAHGQYPVLSLNHTVTTNGSHGPTVQFTANGTGKQFVIGMNGTGTRLDIGFSSATDWNPHNGIDGYNGTTGWRMDNSGNVYNYVSTRSPIFYDSDDTSYYLNANSTSVLNAVNYWGVQFWNGDGVYARGTSTYGYRFNNYADTINAFVINNSGDTTSYSSSRAPIFYDSNDTNYYLNPNSSSRLSSTYTDQSYTYGWFRNYGNQGLYNEDYGNHWYATSNAYWNLAGNNASYVGIILRTGGHQGTTRGYVYADSSNNIGFLGSSGNWKFRVVGDDYSLAEGSSMRAVFYYDSNDTSYYVDPNSYSYIYSLRAAAYLASNGNIYTDSNYGYGLVGVYSSYRYQGVFAMGDAYKLPADGTTTGNLYGLAWSHPNAGGIAGSYLNTHGLLAMENGTWLASLTGSTRARDDMRAPIFYDNNNTGYYCDPASTSYLYNLLLSGASYFRPQTWIQFDGSYGFYWPNHYGAHIHANDLSTYTQIAFRGSKNSYGGFYDYYSAVSAMFDSGGNGGFYREANGRWYIYYHLSNDCLGIGSSSTSSTYGVYCNKGAYFGSRVDGTIFYDSNDNDGCVDPVGHSRLKYTGHVSSGNYSALEIKNTGGTGDGDVACISWHCSGWYGLHMHLRHDGYFGIGGWSASSWRWYLNATNGNMTAAGDVTAYSDPRLKEDITKIESPLEKICKLNGVRFKWIESSIIGHPGKYDYGVLANEVQEVLPEIVSDSIHEAPEGDKYKTVAYDKIVPILIEAIKDQQKIITDQESRISNLEEIIKKLNL